MSAPAKPANLKLLEGRGPGRDSGGRPIKPVPAFVRLAPEAPEHLSPEARAEWERVVPEMQRLELLKTVDRASLAAYCECWSRFVEARMTIAVDGMYLRDRDGSPIKKHPAVLILEAASKELRAWAGQFGLTPAAEANLTAGLPLGDDDEDPYGA